MDLKPPETPTPESPQAAPSLHVFLKIPLGLFWNTENKKQNEQRPTVAFPTWRRLLSYIRGLVSGRESGMRRAHRGKWASLEQPQAKTAGETWNQLLLTQNRCIHQAWTSSKKLLASRVAVISSSALGTTLAYLQWWLLNSRKSALTLPPRISAIKGQNQMLCPPRTTTLGLPTTIIAVCWWILWAPPAYRTRQARFTKRRQHSFAFKEPSM